MKTLLPLALVGLAVASWVPASASAPGPKQLVELEVQDVVPLEEMGTHAVMLASKDGEFVLPIFVGDEAAISIAYRLAERETPHMLSADLLDSMVSNMGGKVTSIRIDDINDHIYSSHVLINQGRKKLELRARPSDAITMALTGDAPIFASKKVLEEAGITREAIERILKEQQPGVGGSGAPGEPADPPQDRPVIEL